MSFFWTLALTVINPLAWPFGLKCGLAGAVLLVLSFYVPVAAPRLRSLVRIVGVALLVLGAAYEKGVTDERAKSQDAVLRAQIAAQARDIEVAKDAAREADAGRQQSDADAATARKRIQDRETELAKLPAAPACRATAGDVRWLSDGALAAVPLPPRRPAGRR